MVPIFGEPCPGREQWQAGLQTPFLCRGPLSPSVPYWVHPLMSPHELHFLNDETRLNVNSMRMRTVCLVCVCLPAPSTAPGTESTALGWSREKAVPGMW